jgi:predicted dehydrogenase
MVGFNRRVLPPLWTATQMLRERVLGEVFHVECIWTHYGPPAQGWRDDSVCLGGIFQDHGSHTIDLCRQWLGEVRTVQAQGRRGKWVNNQNRMRGVEDHVAAFITHQGGGSSYHMNGRDGHRPLSEFYRVCGTDGTLELEYAGDWAFVATDNWDMRLYERGSAFPKRLVSRRPNGESLRELPDGHFAFGTEIQRFIEAIASNSKTVSPSGEEGVAVVRAVSAAYLSALEGRSVTPDEADRFNEDVFKRFLHSITKG